MVFVFTEMHEMIECEKVILNVDLIDELILLIKSDRGNIFANSYNFLYKFNLVLTTWLYELIHTFFMLIFQFIAYFAMVFWLYLFLYSMFSTELHESFFFKKRNFFKKKRFFNL
jgi:hypothetical protein